MNHSELTPEEENLLKRFNTRQHESEDAESRLVEKYGNRAALAKQVWSAIVAIIVFAVLATAWVLSIKSDVERNTRDAIQIRTDLNRVADRVDAIRLELKDKQDRKRDP